MAGMPMMGGFWSLPPDQLDATFMTSMIAHHQGAIDMATLAEERAAHQEVKDLATSIITSQSGGDRDDAGVAQPSGTAAEPPTPHHIRGRIGSA